MRRGHLSTRAPPPRGRAGRAHYRPQGILGAAIATLGRDAGAKARHRDGGRTGAGNVAALRRSGSPVADRRHRHRVGRDPACAVVRAAERIGVGTDISVAALQTARGNAARAGTGPARHVRRLRLCRGAVGAVRSDRIEPALYPICRDRRPRRRSPRITTRCLRSTAARMASTPIARLMPQATRLLAPGAHWWWRRAWPKRRYRGIDDGGRVNAQAPTQSRPGGHPAGAGGQQNAPIKPEEQKTTWNIARERLRSGHNIGPGLLAP